MPDTNLSDLDILTKARAEFTIADDAEREIRTEYTRCMRFIALDQYPSEGTASAAQRTAAGLPALVVDNLGPICDQIINDWIRNRMGIQIGPADTVATEETARVLAGYVRNVEYLSRGRLAYDAAFRQMVRGNRGYVGVMTRRKPGTFKQELYIRRFMDANAVYDDPFSKELDRSDANVMFVRDLMEGEDFKRKYDRDDVDTGFAEWGSEFADWVKGTGVVIAEYWKVRERIRKIQQLTHAIPIMRGKKQIQTDVVYADEYSNLPEGVTVANNPADGGKPMEDDEPERKVCQYEITGKNILSQTQWVGKIIPIVPMIGRDLIVDGKKKIFSAISRSLDAQCQLNYAESGIAEELGTTVRAPYIGWVGQFKTMRQAWTRANLERFAFLEADVVTGPDGKSLLEKPTRQPHEPQIQALVIASDRAQNNIRKTSGLNQTSLGEPDRTAVSGVAKQVQRAEGDNSTFDFPAAGSAALETVGSILVDVAPKILTEPEIIQILDDQEKQVSVLVNADPANHPNAPKGQRDIHMLDQGEYKVRVSAAPSHETMREETEEKLQSIYAEAPEPQKELLTAPLIRAMSFNGKDEIADRVELPQFRKPKDGQPAIPAEAQAVIQQGQQMIQAAQAHIALLERERDAKVAELESRERIEARHDETTIAKARIDQETKTGITAFEGEIESIKHMLDLITAHLKVGAEADSQESAQAHAAGLQTSAQNHAADMQGSQQDAAAESQTAAQDHATQLQESAAGGGAE